MESTISISSDELAKLKNTQARMDHRSVMKKAQNERYWRRKQDLKKAHALNALNALNAPVCV